MKESMLQAKESDENNEPEYLPKWKANWAKFLDDLEESQSRLKQSQFNDSNIIADMVYHNQGYSEAGGTYITSELASIEAKLNESVVGSLKQGEETEWRQEVDKFRDLLYLTNRILKKVEAGTFPKVQSFIKTLGLLINNFKIYENYDKEMKELGVSPLFSKKQGEDLKKYQEEYGDRRDEILNGLIEDIEKLQQAHEEE